MAMEKEFATYLLDELDVEIADPEVPATARQRMKAKLDKLRSVVGTSFGSRGGRRGGGDA